MKIDLGQFTIEMEHIRPMSKYYTLVRDARGNLMNPIQVTDKKTKLPKTAGTLVTIIENATGRKAYGRTYVNPLDLNSFNRGYGRAVALNRAMDNFLKTWVKPAAGDPTGEYTRDKFRNWKKRFVRVFNEIVHEGAKTPSIRISRAATTQEPVAKSEQG